MTEQLTNFESICSNHINTGEVIKEQLLRLLFNDGVIDADTKEKYLKQYGVVIFKDVWYKTIFKNADKDTISIKLTKLIG